jgi:FkbM family methyltransferase
MLTPEQIRQLVGRNDPIILDVGCNDGEHTQMFLDLFPSATVFCFEPDPRAVQRFRMKVTDPRATLFEMALGAWNEDHAAFHQSGGWPTAEARKRLPDGWDLSGSLHVPARHLSVHTWCTFEQRIEVVERRLDTWAVEHDIWDADFIWADVQGAEGDLVRGGLNLLTRTRFFYVEYSDRELYEAQPTLAQLAAMLPHFEVVHAWAEDVLFRNKELACAVH